MNALSPDKESTSDRKYLFKVKQINGRNGNVKKTVKGQLKINPFKCVDF